MQEKILRVIEYGEFQRVGGRETITADVRIVAATNEDLQVLAERGQFRPDLLDRLAFDVIHLPPLRARREDIESLATHFAINVTSELKRELFAGFSAEAMAELLAYPWPGNVRELKNAVERSVYRAEDPALPIETILFDPFASPFAEPAPRAQARASGQSAAAASQTLPRGGLRDAVAEYERSLLEAGLARAKFKQTAAAKLLGLSYHQFRGLLKKHGLDRKRVTG
jgi:psp operon transcriptional activator